MDNVSISQSTRKAYPKHPYSKIKNDILGQAYKLDLNFIGSTRAQNLNHTYRKKNYIPDVLAFPLEKNHGEIFIAPVAAQTKAPEFNLTDRQYIGYLFIHACLHLKGYTHGATMEKAERRYCLKYRVC